MKKLISIFCVVAMIFSLAVTVNAAGTSFALTLKEQTATSVTYELSVDTDVNVQTFGICYDMKDAISKGITDDDITVTGNSVIPSLKAQYAKTQDLISIKLSPDANGFLLTGKATIATIVINTTNMTGAFNFTQASGTSAKNFAVVKKTDAGTETITGEVAFPTATVNPYVAPKTEETAPVNPANENAEFKFDGQTWTNVAIYEASFVLADIDTTKDYGIKEGNNKFSASIAGEGTTTFVLAYYGVTTAPTVEKFWTGK